MKKQLQISVLAATILLPAVSTIAGTIATDGAVPSTLNANGTEGDPSVYIIGNSGPYTQDYGTTPLIIGGASSWVQLYIQNGSTVISGDESRVGSYYASSHILARLTDASSWIVNGKLFVPFYGGSDRLEVFGGSLVSTTNLIIAGGSYSGGTVVVSNANSRVISTGNLGGGISTGAGSYIYLRDNALMRIDGESAYVDRAYFGGGYFAWAGDHTSDSSSPFASSLWNGSGWQTSADFDVRFTITYYATDAEAKAATADPESGFEGYDGLGGYTIWESHLFEETPPESLLLNPGFADGLTNWITDAGTPDTSIGPTPLHDGYLAYFDGSASGQMHQDVDLLAEGYLAADINAGLYAVVFGGWQYSHEGVDVGQISVVFLNASQQELGTVSLPADAPTSWTESLQTNAIPAQTTTLRYVFAGTLGSGGDSRDTNSYLDDAYMDVIDMPPPDVVLTVESAHGTPAPMVGNHTNAYGSTIACSVSNGTEALTQYSCSGWTLTGNEPISGTANAFELILTNNATLAWNWQTNYWLETSVSGSGSIDILDDFYAAGSEQILTATPNSGWLFMGWSGDASGTNDEAFVFMTAPQSITATFSDDADGDGLTNTEEAAAGSNPWKADTDGDGFGDAFEVAKGWNPTVDDSDVADYIGANGDEFGLYPSNVVLDVAMGEILLETSGTEALLNLQLEASDDLVTWTNAGDAVEWIWTVGEEKKFFRVRSSK